MLLIAKISLPNGGLEGRQHNDIFLMEVQKEATKPHIN